MGLDIYVRWDNMTENEKEAQYTGFRSAPNAGYLRQSWGSLRRLVELATEHKGPEPVGLIFPNWDGANDGLGPQLANPLECERLKSVASKLSQWVKDNPKAQPYYLNELAEAAEFIAFALSKAKLEGARIEYS